MDTHKEIAGIRIPHIPSMIDSMLVRGRDKYPARNVWASSVGHPCARRLVYEQVAWEDRADPDAGLLRIFKLGNLHGKAILRDLEDALEPINVRVEQSEVRVPANSYGISGKVDAILAFPNPEGGRRVEVPCELKSTQPHTLSQLNSVDDLWNAEHVYLRQYAAQLLTYIHLLGAPFGMFYFREKSTGKDKQLVMMPDKGRWMEVCNRAEEVNRAVSLWSAKPNEESLPDRVPWTSTVCGKCPFLHVCVPDMSVRAGVADHMGDEEANDCLKRMEELKGPAREHDKLNAKLKRFVAAACFDLKAGEERVLAMADFDVTVKCGERKHLEIPEELKALHTVKKRQLRNTISPAGGE